MKLTTIFYHADNFGKQFEKEFKIRALSMGSKRKKTTSLTLGEVITIVSYYHFSGYKTFKDYYTKSSELLSAFPQMPSYNRFIELQQKACMPLAIFARLQSSGACEGASYIDSFPLRVSNQKRISSHKTFQGMAIRGKTSMGWFYGFKLHLIINTQGEILNFAVTPGNVVDNNQQLIERLTRNISGKIYGDKGYLLNPDLFRKLFFNGIQMVTKIRSNMKNKLMNIIDKFMLKKRGVIESVGAVLKEDLNLEHSRYRSPITLFINVFSSLIAYSFRENKPSINKGDFDLLTA